MKPGRRTTPTALKRLRGNPGKRALPVDEPTPGALADVEPPAHLSRDARTEWRRLVPELCRMGLLTIADLPTFAAYCSAWGDLVQADRALRKEGLVVVGKEGQEVRSPWFLVKIRAADLLVKLGDRFGLSPSARAGISVARSCQQSSGVPRRGSLAAFLASKPDALS